MTNSEDVNHKFKGAGHLVELDGDTVEALVHVVGGLGVEGLELRHLLTGRVLVLHQEALGIVGLLRSLAALDHPPCPGRAESNAEDGAYCLRRDACGGVCYQVEHHDWSSWASVADPVV